MPLDSINQKLLNTLQQKFPLVPEPFEELSRQLGIPSEAVISRIAQFKTDGIIRQLSPIFIAQCLGYQTTLVALKVPAATMDKAAQVIRAHPRISHGYQREHEYNLWVTLATPDTADIEAEVRQIASAIPATTAFQLPSTKLYKIKAYFGLGKTDDPATPPAETQAMHQPPQAAVLSPADRAVINETQQDLPLISRPFAAMANNVGMSEEKLLAQLKSLLERGVMRRFAAAINQRKVGFPANAMACWAIPADKLDMVGVKLATLPEVSHCYERQTNPEWRYNLFAMIHGQREETCHDIANQVSAEYDLNDYITIFSSVELQKVRVKYQV